MARAVRSLMDYVRKHYGVPAKRGMRVKTHMGRGSITGARSAHLRIRLDGELRSRLFHPLTVEYPETGE